MILSGPKKGTTRTEWLRKPKEKTEKTTRWKRLRNANRRGLRRDLVLDHGAPIREGESLEVPLHERIVHLGRVPLFLGRVRSLTLLHRIVLVAESENHVLRAKDDRDLGLRPREVLPGHRDAGHPAGAVRDRVVRLVLGLANGL